MGESLPEFVFERKHSVGNKKALVEVQDGIRRLLECLDSGRPGDGLIATQLFTATSQPT
jgi:hypothetical protein